MMRMIEAKRTAWLSPLCAALACTAMLAAGSTQAEAASKDFPPFKEVIKGYEKVVSTADDAPGMYKIWVKENEAQMLAELPKRLKGRRYFIALTVASGEQYAGLQAGDMYVYWRRYGDRLALIEPNVSKRSSGDQESKDSVERLFTDRVILDVPIVTVRPNGGPVIDLDQLLVKQASKFFGGGVRVTRPNLATIAKAKAFPENVELAFEVPTRGGRLQTLHYSISRIPDNTGYRPRKADQRVGYFVTGYNDLGKYQGDETRVRYINRWHLEKADPSLRLSPPKEPIVFYIEHTTPVRYRRWVRRGVRYWNEAFEKVGLSNAIEVYYQDKRSGAHMDKDPEDVRYNFIRWLNNDEGTAIGPSRVHPLTGQILDADIILTDGWIRHYWMQFHDVVPDLATQGFSPETLAWLNKHPEWDPRVIMADPAQREHMLAERAEGTPEPFGGHPLAMADPKLIGDDEYDGLVGRHSQVNGLCLAARGKAMALAQMQMYRTLVQNEMKSDKAGGEKSESLIDGMPEQFVGPLLAELVAHEVGHTLGLRHNFKASSIYTLAEINSEQVKGNKPFAGSVMDYLPVNINMDAGEIQGDYTMTGIGPYDHWAIQYGYSFKKDLEPILDRVSEPQLAYSTDEDTTGPDPLARRYDFGKDPLTYAREQMRLARHYRGRLLDKFVEDGEPWSRARDGYEMTLAFQTRSLNMMANWVGGSHIHRDKKGDPGNREPIDVVSAERQRKALQFVLENAFRDKSFGLTPKMLRHMAAEKWLDGNSYRSALRSDHAWPVHDRIMNIQASTLTMLMNPSTLRQVYDNEMRVPDKTDMLSLPELLEAISTEVWSELDAEMNHAEDNTDRQPMISSLRRNLQQEHLKRLIDLLMDGSRFGAAHKSIANLARMQLRELKRKIQPILESSAGDTYTRAHLAEAEQRITKALEAGYIYNE